MLFFIFIFFSVLGYFPQGRDKHISNNIVQESLGLEGDCQWQR